MSEHTEQTTLFQEWAKVSKYKHLFDKLLFSIPNEGGKGIQAILRAQKMRREGSKVGTSDMFFAHAQIIEYEGETLFFPGLFIEMKDFGKYLSPEQKKFLEAVRAQGYIGFGVHGWELASQLLLTYIEAAERLMYLSKQGLYFKGVR